MNATEKRDELLLIMSVISAGIALGRLSLRTVKRSGAELDPTILKDCQNMLDRVVAMRKVIESEPVMKFGPVMESLIELEDEALTFRVHLLDIIHPGQLPS